LITACGEKKYQSMVIVDKMGRKEQHLPDSCVYDATKCKEFRKNREKTEAFSQHCDFYQLQKGLSIYG
jgi:hypothetical protein